MTENGFEPTVVLPNLGLIALTIISFWLPRKTVHLGEYNKIVLCDDIIYAKHSN